MIKYKVRIGKKFITISPKPLENIPNGLKIRYNKEGDIVTAFATCDVIKGKQRYTKPHESLSMGRHVQEAYLN